MTDLPTGHVPQEVPSPPPIAEYRQSIRNVVDANPEVFSANSWDVPGRVPPGRQAVTLLGGAGLLAPAAAPAQCDVSPLRYSAVLHKELALLPAGAVVLTQVEVVAKLLSAFSAAAEPARRAVDGLLLGALAVTEPEGGLDFDTMITTVRRAGEHLVLDGEKWFSSNSPFADELLVLARDTGFGDMAPGRHTLLRLPANAPGTSVTALPTLGHRGITGHIRFEGVGLNAGSVLGSPGAGLFALMKHWVHERVMVALRMTAMADGLLGLLLGTAAQSSVHTSRVAAELFAELAQEQAACTHALDLLAIGSCPPPTAAGYKLRAASLLRRTAEAALQVETEIRATEPGFAGLSPADPGLAERVLRDAAGLSLAGGSDEALLMVIGRELR